MLVYVEIEGELEEIVAQPIKELQYRGRDGLLCSQGYDSALSPPADSAADMGCCGSPIAAGDSEAVALG